MPQRQVLSIFVIDDDQMLAMAIRSDLERTFRSQSFRISCFKSGEQTRPHLAEKPDLAFVNCQSMNPANETLSGMNLVDIIKKECPSTEVILLTGEEHAEAAAQTMAHGAHDYVVKDDYMFRHLGLSVSQCLRVLDLKEELRSQQLKNGIVISVGLLACSLLALHVWATHLAG